MTDYTKSVNFTNKDTLPPGDTNKIIRGTELDTELSAVSTAVNSKANTASPTFTGTVTTTGLTASGTFTLGGTAITATAAELNILDGVTATAAELNTLDGITATVTELNYTDGVTSNIQTQLGTKALIANPVFTGTVARIGTSFSDPVTEEVNAVTLQPGATSYTLSGNSFYLHTWKHWGRGESTNALFLQLRRNGDIAGSISASAGGTSYNTTSDGRLKEKIKDSLSATGKVKALRIREFDWKEDKQHQEYGLIAQEARDVFPESVTEDPSGTLLIDYSKFVPMMLKEMQDLRDEVELLKQKE